ATNRRDRWPPSRKHTSSSRSPAPTPRAVARSLWRTPPPARPSRPSPTSGRRSSPRWQRADALRSPAGRRSGSTAARACCCALRLIGVIGPWNYPLTNSFGDCIPALAAGNSVILKPSEITPLTSLLMAEGLRECGLPEHVLQIATGRGGTGAALVEHVDMIMFTGSTRTGRKVAEAAARRLIPASLDLGGKDPMIVLSDAELERAANFATYDSMQNAGQTCISIERVYVEEPVYDEFVANVSEKVRGLRVGKREGHGSVEVGAITFPPQLDTIKDHVTDAIQKGARVLTGGQQVPGAGRFFEPTVLVDVDHSMKIMTEETFGPTLPIMKVRDA